MIKLDIDTATALQALDNEDNGLPSPPSIYRNGGWRNVCPRCGDAPSSSPWWCPACGWIASADPHRCCLRIHDIVPIEGDPLVIYPVDALDIEKAKSKKDADRTPKEKLLAKGTVVEPIVLLETGTK